jgi:hypothetical protein
MDLRLRTGLKSAAGRNGAVHGAAGVHPHGARFALKK